MSSCIVYDNVAGQMFEGVTCHMSSEHSRVIGSVTWTFVWRGRGQNLPTDLVETEGADPGSVLRGSSMKGHISEMFGRLIRNPSLSLAHIDKELIHQETFIKQEHGGYTRLFRLDISTS